MSLCDTLPSDVVLYAHRTTSEGRVSRSDAAPTRRAMRRPRPLRHLLFASAQRGASNATRGAWSADREARCFQLAMSPEHTTAQFRSTCALFLSERMEASGLASYVHMVARSSTWLALQCHSARVPTLVRYASGCVAHQ